MLKAFLIVAGLATAGSAFAIATEPLGNETINYTYDARGRVIEVKRTGSVNNNVTANYTYDDADNRKAVQVTGVP